MKYIIEGFFEAFRIIFSFSPDFIQIVARSLFVSISATILASLVAVPIFIYLGSVSLKGERFLSRLLNTFMSTPSVIVGLIIMLFLSRRGPLGFLSLLYTNKAMIIAQFFLVLPLISAMTYDLSKTNGRVIKNLAKTLGANKWQTTLLIISELRPTLFIYIITAFSRAISEVGAVMMVGGNIEGETRVMTTTISMLNSMGDYPMAIALGIILISVSFGINWISYSFKESKENDGT